MNHFVVALSALFYILFLIGGKRTPAPFEPAQGVIYAADSEGRVESESKVMETPIFVGSSKVTASPKTILPVLDVAVDGDVPAQFIAHVSTAAAWRLVPQGTINAYAKKPSPPRKAAPAKAAVTAATTERITSAASDAVVAETPQQIIYSYPKLKDVIRQSQNSYFFTDKDQTIGGVTVAIQSSTPYQDKDILSFEVRNNGTAYFFIEIVSILKNGQPLAAEVFNKELVRPDQTLSCLALVPRVPKTALILRLVESGGKHRIYEVKYETY